MSWTSRIAQAGANNLNTYDSVAPTAATYTADANWPGGCGAVNQAIAISLKSLFSGSYVQGNASATASTVSSYGSAFVNPNTAGNCIIVDVVFQAGSYTAGPFTISDSQGNTYTLAASGNPSFQGYFMRSYVATGCNAGANTVTLVAGGSFPFTGITMAIHEYAGVSGVVDAVAYGCGASSGVGNTVNLSITTTAGGDLLHYAVGSAACIVSSVTGGGIAMGTPYIANVAPIYGTGNTIQPGQFVSITGGYLATASATWKGNFPTSLAGMSVTINSKAAYMEFVSPTEVVCQSPDDATTGSVAVVVTTASSATPSSTVTLAAQAPAFFLLDSTRVSAIIIRTDGSGFYGGGTYDIAGPAANPLGYQTVPATIGDVLAIFLGGLGPTTPSVPAGQLFSGAAPTNNTVTLTMNGISVPIAFAGLSEAGTYQINVVIPSGLGTGEVSIVATVNAANTQSGIVIALK